MKRATRVTASMSGRSRPAPARVARRASTVALLTIACALLLPLRGDAHGVSGKDALFLQCDLRRGHRSADVSRRQAHGHRLRSPGCSWSASSSFCTASRTSCSTSACSRSATASRCSPACSAAFTPNPYLIDAIIGFSVVYKAFDNMGGFQRLLRLSAGHARRRAAVRPVSWLRPRDEAAGLLLSPNGLVANIVSFNVGVEIGQVLALTAVLIAADRTGAPRPDSFGTRSSPTPR